MAYFNCKEDLGAEEIDIDERIDQICKITEPIACILGFAFVYWSDDQIKTLLAETPCVDLVLAVVEAELTMTLELRNILYQVEERSNLQIIQLIKAREDTFKHSLWAMSNICAEKQAYFTKAQNDSMIRSASQVFEDLPQSYCLQAEAITCVANFVTTVDVLRDELVDEALLVFLSKSLGTNHRWLLEMRDGQKAICLGLEAVHRILSDSHGC